MRLEQQLVKCKGLWEQREEQKQLDKELQELQEKATQTTLDKQKLLEKRRQEELQAEREKRVQVGLTYVYGIGQTTANKILEATGINPDTRVKDLTLEEEAKIRDYIDQANIIVEGDLRRNVALDIKRLVEIQSFRGTRHRKNLPCRGQRTKTNARTCKGPKRTVANKKK